MGRAFFAAAAIGVAAWITAAAALSAQPQAGVDYATQIAPIIKRSCLECHSQDRRKGGLSLQTYGDMLDGGRNGAIIRPGNGAGSTLVHHLTGALDPQMPKDEDPLPASEIAVIQRWIDQGARETPNGPSAPAPWEAPMELTRPAAPAAVWGGWTSPIDRVVASYLSSRGVAQPAAVTDALYARRVYLDVWGLLPPPGELEAFVTSRDPGKRTALVSRLLADRARYAEHWISFWNDLLRNEDGVTYFSETAGRKSITDWLVASLQANVPYDTFVRSLIDPADDGDPDGFLIGVNWRGETSAAVTPWMQASQNTAQIFLGVNLKCNACHDSFVSKWKLKDAYSLAAFFSPDARLQLYRCDVAQNRYAEPAFLFPAIAHTPASGTLAERRRAAAAAFTDRRNGRFARTIVNRVWQRLLGHGLVANPDEMDGRPWSPELLDTLAADFVEHGYDLKRLINDVLTSRTYQMAAVARRSEPAARGYVFAGPEVRRLTAEQFSDAVGQITGEWNTYPGRPAVPGGVYAREWRVASSAFTRALGRPVRDQVTSVRPSEASPLQALELVNGESYTHRLSRGARRLLGALPPEPASLFNRAVGGRSPQFARFDVDVSKASALWLLVQDEGSNAPERIQPIWAEAELVTADGTIPLAALTPRDPAGLRAAAGGPLTGVTVKNPSVLVYDLAGKNVTRLRGRVALENAPAEIGSTLNPQVRFFVFDTAPNMERLVPPAPAPPLPADVPATNADAAIDRVFAYALSRAPNAAERRIARETLRATDGRVAADGLADLLWAITMKAEFQFIW